MNYKIDIKRILDGNVEIKGWALSKNAKSKVNFKVEDAKGNEVPFSFTRTKRDDVSEIYFGEIKEDTYFGFEISLKSDENDKETFYLLMIDGSDVVREKINRETIKNFNSADRKKKELLLAYFNKNTFKRAIDFLFKEGPVNFIKKAKRKISGINADYDYDEWYRLTCKTDDEIAEERLMARELLYKPFFSIVIPVYDTEDKYLKSLFSSILHQTYQNFEVCVADATDYTNARHNPKSFFENILNKSDPLGLNIYNYNLDNIHVKYLSENKSIADNTNEAISIAKGEYIVLVDHDDALTYDALYEMALAINNNKNVEFLYSDEDKVDMNDDNYFEPNFKPDFNLDMFLSVNYFCHLSVIKKTLLDEIYMSDGNYEMREYNGAQDYDFFLRIVNNINNKTYNDGFYDTSKIYHIKKVLYHWRCHKESTSKNVESKLYAFKNGELALKKFYERTKINFPKILDVVKGSNYGIYKAIYAKDYEEPLVSIIIPNKDHIDDLRLTIESVKKGEYKNIEFIICENNSTNDKTFKYYEELKKEQNVTVVYYDGTFNYSKINNFAYRYAKGDYILFLNNDVEMISNESIHEMLSYIKRDDVGAVGAKLLYKDKTYQHAGVVIGIGGIADHIFKNISIYDKTYMGRSEMVCDYNAVTAACLMTKRSVFDKVGGFDENIAVAFNDIDLCLKIRKLGYLIVYNPYSSFYHYESKSRGYEDTKEKVERFNREFAFFVHRWKDKLNEIDEYYNPNLTLRQNNAALRNIKYEKIGEPFPIPKEIEEIIKKNHE